MLNESFWHDDNRVRCLNLNCWCLEEHQETIDNLLKEQDQSRYNFPVIGRNNHEHQAKRGDPQ